MKQIKSNLCFSALTCIKSMLLFITSTMASGIVTKRQPGNKKAQKSFVTTQIRPTLLVQHINANFYIKLLHLKNPSFHNGLIESAKEQPLLVFTLFFFFFFLSCLLFQSANNFSFVEAFNTQAMKLIKLLNIMVMKLIKNIFTGALNMPNKALNMLAMSLIKVINLLANASFTFLQKL